MSNSPLDWLPASLAAKFHRLARQKSAKPKFKQQLRMESLDNRIMPTVAPGSPPPFECYCEGAHWDHNADGNCDNVEHIAHDYCRDGNTGGDGKGSGGKGSGGKGSHGKGSGGKGSGGKGSNCKSSHGKGSGGKQSHGKGSGGKQSHGKGSGGKQSHGKGSGGKCDIGGKQSHGKGSGGKQSHGRGSNGKQNGGKNSNGKHSNGKGGDTKCAAKPADKFDGLKKLAAAVTPKTKK